MTQKQKSDEVLRSAELRRQLTEMTRDRDENEEWRHRLHAEIKELKANEEQGKRLTAELCGSMLAEWQSLCARMHTLEIRLGKLGYVLKHESLFEVRGA